MERERERERNEEELEGVLGASSSASTQRYRPNFNCACSSPEHFLAVLILPHPTCHHYCIQLHVCLRVVVNNGSMLKMRERERGGGRRKSCKVS